jgi:hypothetical protein
MNEVVVIVYSEGGVSTYKNAHVRNKYWDKFFVKWKREEGSWWWEVVYEKGFLQAGILAFKT